MSLQIHLRRVATTKGTTTGSNVDSSYIADIGILAAHLVGEATPQNQ